MTTKARLLYLEAELAKSDRRLEALARVTELTGRSYHPTKRGLDEARADIERLKNGLQ